MSKTLVTVEQYAQCVIEGLCSQPHAGGYCNWGKPGNQFLPINCVTWDQANQYAKFSHLHTHEYVRLPTESEWEYAAAGDKTPRYYDSNCDDTSDDLCDMGGSVSQWVQDRYADSYRSAPLDGTALSEAGACRVFRGGSLSVIARGANYPDSWFIATCDLSSALISDREGDSIGIRLVK
jgi:formylglycine-generating enzyme required for sulfatase activity